MKKWTILVIVVLAALILLVQYVIEKKVVPAGPGGSQAPVAEQPLGVALPEDAAVSAARAVGNFVPETSGSVYGGIALPTIQPFYKGACEGGSLKEMLDTHDRYWGFFARNTAFTPEESNKMYNLLADYVGCQASARTDTTLCDNLPGVAEKDGQKVPKEITPHYICRDKTVSVLYEGYRAGLVKDEFPCRAMSERWDKTRVAMFSVPELCRKISEGRAPALSYLKGIFTAPEAAPLLEATFPVKEADCAGDRECLNRYAIFKGVKSGNAKACPKEYATYCQALSERSALPCDKTLQEMSKFYCATVSRVKKATGGYIGMSKADIAAEIEKAKAVKNEADMIKKEQEKQQAEVNKRAKELLNSK